MRGHDLDDTRDGTSRSVTVQRCCAVNCRGAENNRQSLCEDVSVFSLGI